MTHAQMVAIDGTDALAFVIVRPAADGKVSVEAGANGMDRAQAAYVLRQVADKWDAEADAE